MGFAGPSITAALAFSLAAMALVSLVWFRASTQSADISTSLKRLRAFKNESKTIPLQIHSNASRGMRLKLVSVGGQAGLESELRERGDGATELLLRSRYAGRSEQLTADFQTTDPLGLFVRRITVHLDLTYESLPLALKTPSPPIAIYPLSYGDSPSGRKGPGLELYAVGRYQPAQDPRDIMWKKAAGMTDESLPMREREANVRKSVRVMVAVRSGSEEERARRNDLVAEAIARVGKQLLSAGTEVEIGLAMSSRQNSQMVRASNLKELADATLLEWTSEAVPRSMKRSPCDILIIGPSEFRDDSTLATAGSARLLLVTDEKLSLAHTPNGVTVFSGKEDLTNLIASVSVG
jgi:uncharacterized protein (DUF58 family)